MVTCRERPNQDTEQCTGRNMIDRPIGMHGGCQIQNCGTCKAIKRRRAKADVAREGFAAIRTLARMGVAVEPTTPLSREHPYEECRKREAFEAFLLKLVETKGGCVVSSNDCSEWEIVAARACDRFYVDSRAYGYVIRPSARVAEREKTSEKQTAVVRHSLASTENAAVTSSPAEAPQEPGATPAPCPRCATWRAVATTFAREGQSEDAQVAETFLIYIPRQFVSRAELREVMGQLASALDTEEERWNR